jgi:hypothetical protein
MENTENQVMQILTADAVEAINRSEIDTAIMTAKKFPRDLTQVKKDILTLATMTQETAESCFYILKRKNKKGQVVTIEGESVRFAEIVISSWGNINAGFRIVGNDGKKITAMGVCHDLQKNVRYMGEVQRRITTSEGRTYSDDMQIMTGNAAGAIAFRNAVFKVIPKAIVAGMTAKIKSVAIGDEQSLSERVKEIFKLVRTEFHVKEEKIFELFDKKSKTEFTNQEIFELRGIYNALKEGTTTVEETFYGKNTEESKEETKQDIARRIANDEALKADPTTSTSNAGPTLFDNKK